MISCDSTFTAAHQSITFTDACVQMKSTAYVSLDLTKLNLILLGQVVRQWQSRMTCTCDPISLLASFQGSWSLELLLCSQYSVSLLQDLQYSQNRRYQLDMVKDSPLHTRRTNSDRSCMSYHEVIDPKTIANSASHIYFLLASPQATQRSILISPPPSCHPIVFHIFPYAYLSSIPPALSSSFQIFP